MTEKIAILYAVTGKRFISEALASIASLRANSNHVLDIYVTTTREFATHFPEDAANVIITDDADGFSFKVKALAEFVKADKFIFLDSDTYVLGLPNNLHAIWAAAPISGVQDPLLDTWKHNTIKRPMDWHSDIALPELNSGVLFVNRTHARYENIIEKWAAEHKILVRLNPARKSVPDQASLMQALVSNNILPLYLDNRFNLRACYPVVVVDRPYIIHSHTPNPAIVARWLSSNTDMAVQFPWGLSFKRRGTINRYAYWLYRRIYD